MTTETVESVTESESITCSCGNEHTVGDARGECRDCDNETCTSCASEPLINGERRTICEDCLGRYSSCDDCSDLMHEDDSYSCGDSLLCSLCFEANYSTCDYCREVTPDSDIASVGGSQVCGSCVSEHCSSCPRCDELFHYDHGRYCDYTEQSYCSSYCRNEASEESGCRSAAAHHGNILERGYDGIAEYHRGPELSPTDSNRTDTFGFELEVMATTESSASSGAQEVARHLGGGNYKLELDGSVGQYGFEIITKPITRDEYRKANWYELVGKLKATGITSHNAKVCGLHVHIDNRACSSSRGPHLRNRYCKLFSADLASFYELRDCSYAARQFMYHCREFFGPISRRESFGYCNIEPCSTGHKDKYQAVNLGRDSTTEIRLWRGTLSYPTLRASILLSLAIIDYWHITSPIVLKTKAPAVVFQRFCQWLKREPRYQCLYTYLAGKNPRNKQFSND